MDTIPIAELSQSIEATQNSETEDKYLTFWTDGQLFGLPIADVEQIIGMQPITRIPEYPEYAKGIMNLRGSVMPVIDMRLRLGRAETAHDDRTCIIVTSIRKNFFGFIVDEVDEVLIIESDRISPPPQIGRADSSCQYLTGVGQMEKGITLLIDSAKILGDDEYDTLASAL